MMSDINTNIEIYYGPLSWFRKQVQGEEYHYLLDIINELDKENRQFIHRIAGQRNSEEEKVKKQVRCVVAESMDFVSLQEHAIMNFFGLLRPVNPEKIILHNPPHHIHIYIEREFSNFNVKKYSYPVITESNLVEFYQDLPNNIIGQDKAKELLSAALYPLINRQREKPVVLMLYGPSGVGKTETAKFLSRLTGGSLMRKQFSMFQNEKFSSYIFGGSHSEDSFARDLLNRESGVILLDEFDKANSIFHSAFYQFFDDGIFEDKNYRVELGASLVICTSNYATEGEIRQELGDPLYSRFDALIEFMPLSKGDLRRVVSRLVDNRYKNLNPYEQRVICRDEIKDKIYSVIANTGNIRKLDKLIEGLISLKLMRELVSGHLSNNTTNNINSPEP
jgi:protease-related protein